MPKCYNEDFGLYNLLDAIFFHKTPSIQHFTFSYDVSPTSFAAIMISIQQNATCISILP
jgi:hypothetical protein